MALVDYSSDSSSDAETGSGEPPPKRPKLTPNPAAPVPAPQLPPLPPAFHDLYASTVRTTTSDDPALHQGRTRQVPHVPGNWPSHLYVEWHPSRATYALLTSLVSTLQGRISSQTATQISSFLTSDLDAPLPLHISLSRPVTLTSAEKDTFLSQLASSISECGIHPFELSCRGVEWHRTEESGRSFLVLRVQRSATAADDDAGTTNPELAELLRRCNSIVGDHGQPLLYQWAVEGSDDEKTARGDRVGRAFHVSIAWSFAKPTEELRRLTDEVFGEQETKGRIQQTEIRVDGIKAKIGNVVTHIPLPQPGRRTVGKGSRNLLGL